MRGSPAGARPNEMNSPFVSSPFVELPVDCRVLLASARSDKVKLNLANNFNRSSSIFGNHTMNAIILDF